MLSLNHPLADLKGADYNPRRIDPSAIERLQESIRILGVCKPIIARGQTIVAGHQRTKALRSIGVTHAPVFLLSKDASTYDEVRFNQLHNGTDLDLGDEQAAVRLPEGTGRGFVEIDPDDIAGNLLSRGAKIRSEICRLMLAYGAWGACVATDDGEIIHAAQYALACKMLGKACLVYVVPAPMKEQARGFLSSQYGVFSYEHIHRDSFVQTFAQMFRLRGGKKDNKSPTYEVLVKPWLAANPGARVLDFGCGQGDYVKALRAQGVDITGLEFFRRKGDAIDLEQVNRMIDTVTSKLRTAGRFDAVILDYVLNSVDSQQAEEDVLNSIDALCRPGGTLFFSGRSMARVEDLMRHRSAAYKRQMQRNVEFLDENGLTALYRKGSWFFQKFHDDDDIQRMCRVREWTITKRHSTPIGFNIQVQKNRDSLPVGVMVDSLRREFDMPINRAGRTLGRATDIETAILPCLS
jgi:ParB family chromosome partitioning protein